MVRITVFTPTFNRAYTLHKCYESLIRQTNQNFEWLIIDDGSTDNTNALVNKWQLESRIKIRYIYKENGGMHSGYNVAYDNISTELSVCVDSDDYLLDDAIEKIVDFWDNNKSDDVAGVVGLNVTNKSEIIGKPLPNLKRIKIYDYYNRLKGRGDKKMIYRPEIMRKFKSPEFKGEKLFPTAYKYFNADLEYDMLVINEPFCVVEYMEDGFTNNIIKQYKNNLKSFIYYREFIMKYPRATMKHKLNSAIHYIAENKLAKNRNWIKSAPNKVYVISMLPLGYLLYAYILKKG